ncbi:MAG: hypothetical protein EGS63_12675 [Lachnospira sp.]|nr:hypothetical protein [Lachnospira sp.]
MIGKNNLPIFFFVGVYMKNRFIILLLSFSILCISIFALPLSIVYATDSYGYTYEEAVDIVNKHNIIYSNEGTPMFIYSSASQLWSAPRYFFTNTYTDKELVDILSSDNVIQYAVTKAKYESISSQLCKALGYATKGASTLVTDMVAKDNRQFAKGTYSDDDGYSLVADSVDKLREQLKKQYYDSIGMLEIKPSGNVKTLLSKSGFKAMFEQTDDYNDTYARVNNYAYAFVCGYEFSSMTCYRTFFMNELPKYLYLDTTDTKGYSYSDSWYKCYRLAYYDDSSHAFSFNNSVDVYTYHYADSITPLSDMSLYYSFSRGFCYFPSFNTSDYNHSYYKEFMYFGNSSFWFFKSFEALYDYLHGSQNAYLSSKVEQTGEDIKISIDDMNTNISDKMNELIDSINGKKDGMSADELQKAIDKGLASLSGKMDDIKDNTQETNSKLDSLLTVMQSQNEILLNILGVTTDIYTVVSSKDDEQDKAYDINYVQAVFNTMFKGLKNAVLYGQNTIKQDVNQDTDDVNSLVTDVSPDNVNYRNGLFGKFPFSVPYQLFEWLQVLCVELVAPSFTLSYDFLLKDFIDEENRDNFKLIIDLNDDKYKEWADLMRSGEKLAFTIYMAIATYNRFKNEV